ncbi:conjugal transfer protein TrbC [Diaphorobacter sp. J5-51]|nr:conjugal transfer protein TrbC [Diaphorobacter sp. J5-51]
MNELPEQLRQASPVGEQDNMAQQYDMQIFISAGMPEGVLKHLFSQATEFPRGRVRFVLRGFTPQKIGPLIAKLRALMPDPNADDLVIEVDPGAFRAYAVDAVPVYLVKEKSPKGDKWFEVRGTQSLKVAQQNVKRRSSLMMGELYAISEPDILSVIEDRAKNNDWEPVIARAKERAMRNLKPGFDLPTATETTVRFFTPTFTVPHDIESPGKEGQGKVLLAREGQVVKLLEHTKLPAPIIVFDPSDVRQTKLVKSWLKKKEYSRADLFVVGFNLQSMDAKTPVTLELANTFKRPVYPWMAKLNERMGVESVPSIVEQEGDRLKIQSISPQAYE